MGVFFNGLKLKLGWVYTLLCIMSLGYSGFHILTNIALKDAKIVPPLFTSIRIFGSVIVYTSIGLLGGYSMKISWKDLKETGLAGLLGVTINQACFIFGLYYTSAINAAALQPTQPVFTAIGMLVLRKEKFSMLKLASILTTIAGCMCLMFIEGGSHSQADANPHMNLLLGNSLLVINCFAAGVYLIVLYPLNKRVNIMALNSWLFVAGGIPIWIWLTGYVSLYGTDCFDVLVGEHAMMVWIAIGYAALIATCLTYFLKTYCMKHTTPTIVSAFAPVQPLGAAILSIFFLGESPTLGAPIIVLGMWGVLYARSLEVKQEAAAHAADVKTVVVDKELEPVVDAKLAVVEANLAVAAAKLAVAEAKLALAIERKEQTGCQTTLVEVKPVESPDAKAQATTLVATDGQAIEPKVSESPRPTEAML